MYQKLTYNDVAERPDQLFAAHGMPSTYNPKRGGNPDAEWIPGWDQLELTDETQLAVIQAAANRTWTKQVHADYAAYRAAWAEIDRSFRPELQRAAALPGYYAPAKALAKLVEDVRAAAVAKKVALQPGHPLATTGLLGEIASAIVNLHARTNATPLLTPYLNKVKLDVSQARPFADDAIERDLFTITARKLGTPAGTPALSGWGVDASPKVKWPIAKARVAEVEQARQRLVKAPPDTILNPETLLGGSAGAGAVVSAYPIGDYGPLRVVKVTAKQVEIESKYENNVPYDCAYTGERYANGDRIQKCKYRKVTSRSLIEIAGADAADAVELKQGDEVTLIGKLDDKTEGKDVQRFRLVAARLTSVKRDGKVIASFW